MAAAVTFARLNASNYHVKYLVTADGAAAGNLNAAGGATPDLITDTTANTPIRNLLDTACPDQATARALMRAATAMYTFVGGGTATADWIIDFNTDGAGNLRVTCTAAAADAVGCVLTLGVVHSSIR